MNRRDTVFGLIALGAVAGPFGVRAQQPERARRIGVLMGYAETDAEAQLRLAAFKERLAVLGWAEGRNLMIDVRWLAGEADRAAGFAKELVALKPDVILTTTTPLTGAGQQATMSIPIVFTAAFNPIVSGSPQLRARPGSHSSGFHNLASPL